MHTQAWHSGNQGWAKRGRDTLQGFNVSYLPRAKSGEQQGSGLQPARHAPHNMTLSSSPALADPNQVAESTGSWKSRTAKSAFVFLRDAVVRASVFQQYVGVDCRPY